VFIGHNLVNRNDISENEKHVSTTFALHTASF